MKSLITIAVLAVATLATPALAADVGVSISVGDPGFYGRLDIGGYSQPQLVYHQPRVMYRASMHREPIYLRVPPGHSKNWRKHCRKYDACHDRVYFVRDDWYNRDYAPRYREQHGNRHGGMGSDRNDHRGNDNGRGDHRDNDRSGSGRNH
jgi:hypothetical protein